MFKITGKDDFSREGIVILTCKKDSIDSVKDDIVNGIAGFRLCSIKITNIEDSLNVEQTL